MNFNQITRALRVIKRSLHQVLEQEAEKVIDGAISRLEKSKAQYDRYRRRTDLVHKRFNDWGYEILDTPLRFKIANYKGYKLRPDIICDFRWQKEGALPTSQELVLRVWSADEHLCYREDDRACDSELIGELVTASNGLSERVMLRCHFDLSNPNQSGPLYHLQIGGNPRVGEYGWYPKEFDLPRLPHHPLDIVLLCQLIVTNFFPLEYERIRVDPSWHWAVTTVEKYLLEAYYVTCLSAIRNKKTTLVDEVWNRFG